ncbi:MAG: hypothetical protein IIB66_00760 [Proteobacteria bacterium]|nr:hypothetical protein [Pseudomonadota bacterium]
MPKTATPTGKRDLYAEIPAELKHDCKKCQSLCCTALRIEWDGGEIKEQDVVCEHLTDDFTCGVWDKLESLGRGLCRRFFCLNSGPEICSPLFREGTDWRKTPEIAPLLFNEFRRVYIERFKAILGADPEKNDAKQTSPAATASPNQSRG